jgi:hypothetical protein
MKDIHEHGMPTDELDWLQSGSQLRMQSLLALACWIGMSINEMLLYMPARWRWCIRSSGRCFELQQHQQGSLAALVAICLIVIEHEGPEAVDG